MSLSYSDLATGAVRSWVLLYTAGLAHEAREARRAEIDSDLWEHMSASHSDGDAAQTVREMLSRWLRGITADIFWRFSLKGEPRMVSQDIFVRAGGVAILVIVASLIGLVAANFGIGTGEYFRDHFPKFAGETGRGSLGMVVGGVLAFAAVFGAGALFWTFRPYQPLMASLGAALLVVAGLAMVASVTAGVLLIDLAEEWTARGAVINDGVWASAHHVAKIHEGLGFTSAFFLIGSLAVFGGLISAKGAVPRWVGWIGAASGLALGLALIGSAAGEAPFWWTFVASAALGLLWLVVTGAWLAVKGVYQPAN